jgi:mRNA-degrading endonuclease RelE of RelBE toxin-antitoxin system
MKLTFVETSWFTKRLKARLSDEHYRAFQKELMANPKKGKPMGGCGGVRKVRFADPSRGEGKRGGVRIIYLFTREAFRIDLLDVYGKDEKEDLTAAEKKMLARLAATARQDAIYSYGKGKGTT